MKSNNFLVQTVTRLSILAIILFVANTAFAQKSGKTLKTTYAMPAGIESSYFKKKIKGNNGETRYFFDVNPGEVVLNIRVKSDVDNAGVELYFRDKENNDVSELVLAQDPVDTTVVKKITVDKKTRVFLLIKELSYGSRSSYPGTLEINFSGTFVPWVNPIKKR